MAPTDPDHVSPFRAPVQTLADWPESRILRAMRAWRQGCGALLPWFRATPFAAANHYRDRDLAIAPAARPPRAVTRLLDALPPRERGALWIFDLPGPAALWLAYELRRRWRMASALAWNGWYDPVGVLDGRVEIPLLLGLAGGLRPAAARAAACLVFDGRRHHGADGAAAARLDNRYALGDEDAPSHSELRAGGWRRVSVFTAGAPARDLAEYLEYVRSELPVLVTVDVISPEGSDA